MGRLHTASSLKLTGTEGEQDTPLSSQQDCGPSAMSTTAMATSQHPPSGTRTAGHDGDSDLPEYEHKHEDALEHAIDKHLKSAFFDLARAKQALGPSRVGPASFNLSRIEPVLTVDIVASARSQGGYEFRLNQLTPPPPRKPEDRKGKGREFPTSSSGGVDLRFRGSTSESKSGDTVNEKGNAGEGRQGGLRSRAKKTFTSKAENTAGAAGAHTSTLADNRFPSASSFRGDSQEAPSEDKQKTDKASSSPSAASAAADEPPTYSEAINDYLLDPIQQFSAFPPVTLRSSQKAFRLALQEGIKVLKAQQQYASLCDLVEEGKGGDVKKRS